MSAEITVPRKVREAEELADRLQRELLQPIAPTADAPPPNGEQAPPAAATPAPPNDGSQPPAATPPAQPSVPTDSWEHRYKVLEGKYRAEVPRLAQENKTLKDDLAAMKSRLDEMEAAKNREPLVRPEEIEEFGPGLVDLARRIAREELATKDGEIARLNGQIESLTTITSNNVDESFYKSLAGMVPDWEAMNVDPGFIDWLGVMDDFAGEPRMNLLQRAFEARDALRTAKFFQTFKQTKQSWAANAETKLNEQVTPPASPTPPAPPAKKIWTRPEIAQFYNGVRRGQFSEADAIAIEADINAALIEGRIR